MSLSDGNGASGVSVVAALVLGVCAVQHQQLRGLQMSIMRSKHECAVSGGHGLIWVCGTVQEEPDNLNVAAPGSIYECSVSVGHGLVWVRGTVQEQPNNLDVAM